MAITKLNAAALPAGSIVKSETKIISAFGDTAVASTSSYNDVTGTEVSFSRTFANSKILGLWNLKFTSYRNLYLKLNRKIGSGSYAVVNVGGTGTQGGRTSAQQIWGSLYNDTAVNAMGYGIFAQQYTFLDESGEGLTDTTDAISYKVSISGSATTSKIHLNIDGHNSATNYNKTVESSVTFMEIKV
tara:strand:+ start:793 stop:1353 length:561 start_codon:yes stop_codon:yes gene_type:complete